MSCVNSPLKFPFGNADTFTLPAPVMRWTFEGWLQPRSNPIFYSLFLLIHLLSLFSSYGPGDAVEKWLNQLLCLDATIEDSSGTFPVPSHCDLYAVNRDTLFSYNKVSEIVLQRIMALYVASHYKVISAGCAPRPLLSQQHPLITPSTRHLLSYYS